VSLKQGIPQSSAWLDYPDKYKITGIEIMFSYDIIDYNRQTYSVLEFLGDLGGLYDALYYLGHFIVAHYATRALDTSILSGIFKKRKAVDETNGEAANIDQRIKIDFEQVQTVDKQPQWRSLFTCLTKESRRKAKRWNRQMALGKKKYNREMDLKRFINK